MGTDQETFINVSEADEDVPQEKAHIDETSDEEGGVHEKLITELTADDIFSMEFYSEQEAIKFYTNYARCHGFVSRRHNISKVKGKVVMRELVCSREGLRERKYLVRLNRIREHRPLTRCNCPAKFRVRQNKETKKWEVVGFREKHNYELTLPQFMHKIPKYRGLSEGDQAQVDSLRSRGVRTCHILGYMLAQKGGHQYLGFCKKDLYNHFDRRRRARVEDGDAFAALCYLQAKAANDPTLFAKFTLTENGALQHLFWADGGSRVDYQCFGDVLAFDATYKKNKYNRPLVIFSGLNHHGQTAVFGCAIVADETIETYKWVLEAFLEAMCQKHPNVVVTDGDLSMREAIKDVFPDTYHRLCWWHLYNNAREHVKNSQFLKDFNTAMYASFTPEKFESHWKKMTAKGEISSLEWVKTTYANKRMWAPAYLRGQFFGGIRTTSRCEGINSFINRYVSRKSSLVDFMHSFDNAVRDYRDNEVGADYESLYTEPVMKTTLNDLERHASKIFTRKMFVVDRDEIQRRRERKANRGKRTETGRERGGARGSERTPETWRERGGARGIKQRRREGGETVERHQ
ncbi:hypothetical protein RIF29_40054 [Crotalaria pallida]|uniref:Protein FAR1-RELATED SEQUENCE n=1 Tax=Crotalaria pallida TaxID=3830 RepID=A0AAN9HQ99_CROPI